MSQSPQDPAEPSNAVPNMAPDAAVPLPVPVSVPAPVSVPMPEFLPVLPVETVGDPRADRVAAAVRTWQRHLVDLGGRNTLLWYRDLPSGTLDLTTAHPGGLAMLLAGRPTRLSDLMREATVLEQARRRVRTIRAKTLELHEERGITAGFMALGMATWHCHC